MSSSSSANGASSKKSLKQKQQQYASSSATTATANAAFIPPPAALRAAPASSMGSNRPETPETPETPLPALLALVACAMLLIACAYHQLASVTAAEAPAASPLNASLTAEGRDEENGAVDGEAAYTVKVNRRSLLGVMLSHLAAPEGRTRMLCVAFLCLQYSVYALLRRYATGILREDWSMASVLGIGEAIKFVIALGCIGMWSSASEAPAGPFTSRLIYLISHSGKMAVPAFLYLAMNMLGFVSLRRLDAGTFAIIQQSKVFFTALFQRLLLQRKLSIPKWCALILLVLGVTLISLMAQPSTNGCGPWAAQPWPSAAFGSTSSGAAPSAATPPATSNGLSSYAVGVLAVSADSAMSGFATVYFEKVLRTTVLTVWDRNLQLAFWSIVIYLPWSLYEQPANPLHGWSLVTLLLALLGALGGILVALVIKHADGLAKNLATASSIVLTTAAGHVLFGGPMSTAIIIGSMIVVVAGYTYQKVP